MWTWYKMGTCACGHGTRWAHVHGVASRQPACGKRGTGDEARVGCPNPLIHPSWQKITTCLLQILFSHMWTSPSPSPALLKCIVAVDFRTQSLTCPYKRVQCSCKACCPLLMIRGNKCFITMIEITRIVTCPLFRMDYGDLAHPPRLVLSACKLCSLSALIPPHDPIISAIQLVFVQLWSTEFCRLVVKIMQMWRL